MSWTGNVVDIVVANKFGWESVSISGVGVTLIVDNWVGWIMLLLEFFVISRVAVGELIGVQSALNVLEHDKLISDLNIFSVELDNRSSIWVGKEMSGSSNIIDVVVGVHHFHDSRSITSIGLAHVVDDIIVHVFVLMDISIIG
jgi:hypothetical protein